MTDDVYADRLAPHHGAAPMLAAGAWVHPRATVIGEVSLGRDVSVWPGAVIRGDVNSIAIGEASNIQAGSVLHVSHKTPLSPAGGPLVVGARVPVGKVLEAGQLYLGRPAKLVRRLTDEEIAYFSYSAQHYVALSRSY